MGDLHLWRYAWSARRGAVFCQGRSLRLQTMVPPCVDSHPQWPFLTHFLSAKLLTIYQCLHEYEWGRLSVCVGVEGWVHMGWGGGSRAFICFYHYYYDFYYFYEYYYE